MRTDVNTIEAIMALLSQVINSDTDTDGEIIDTENAVDKAFAMTVQAKTAGDIKYQIFESDANNMAGATLIAASNVTGKDYDSVILFANLTAKETRVFSVKRTMSKRFLRVRAVSSNSANYIMSGQAILGSLTRSVADADNIHSPV